MIGQSSAIIYSDERFAWLIHPGTEIGQRLAAYRHSPVAAGLSLAVTDDKVTLLELDVTFLDGQKLARPHAAVTLITMHIAQRASSASLLASFFTRLSWRVINGFLGYRTTFLSMSM